MSCNENFDEYTTENEELLNSIDVHYTVLTPVVIATNEDEYYTLYGMPESTERNNGNIVDNSLMPLDQNENSTGKKADPFSDECRIPIPGENDDYFLDNKTCVRRRNERERTRVRNVNDGFERLRQHLPLIEECHDKRSSKVETLRLAIRYIRHLENLLKEADQK
ncbi:uncharacterized protein B4U80_06768 [Leptotrombidium deliense]|uniref:BHLH domain-containing protein n=1 Tax=Leptotrombidium deliense TaxID=299467 RepID=A0A443S355_9ACAR|nr:uncharacterized protein B4U80_06768 [Leptotrombidium deliense]